VGAAIEDAGVGATMTGAGKEGGEGVLICCSITGSTGIIILCATAATPAVTELVTDCSLDDAFCRGVE
jgi:hypothetical protein